MKVVNKPKRNVPQATKIQILMRKHGVPEQRIADEAGVKSCTVNKVIWGITTSANIQSVIARKLGFDSWEELLAHREVV